MEPIVIELTEEESERLRGADGSMPAELVAKLRASLLGSLPAHMGAEERQAATRKLDEILGDMGDMSAYRFAMDSLLRLVERYRRKLEDMPSLVLSLARLLETGGLDSPHIFRLGGVFESVAIASELLQSAEKALKEVSGCPCFPGDASKAKVSEEKAPPA